MSPPDPSHSCIVWPTRSSSSTRLNTYVSLSTHPPTPLCFETRVLLERFPHPSAFHRFSPGDTDFMRSITPSPDATPVRYLLPVSLAHAVLGWEPVLMPL